MFDVLAEKLQATLADVRGHGTLTEDDINAATREIRLALLEADVNFKVVKEFTATVKQRCLDDPDIVGGLNPGQQVVKIVHEELATLFGGASAGLAFSPRPPTVVLMAGLQGAGKTTAAAKLAHYLKRENGSSVALAACDLQRPAAVQQLVTMGERAGATVYAPSRGDGRDAVAVAKWALEQTKADGKDVLIVDTAGRLHIDRELMDELVEVRGAVKPHAVLLVVDAMTGQDAVNVAQEFAEAVAFDGVVMTKLDGDARGGAALSVKAVTGKPILFASVGEKIDQLERFHPERMAQRVLGMGDVMSLVEKAAGAVRRRRGGRARAPAAQQRVHVRGLPQPAEDDPPDGPAVVGARDDSRASGQPARGREDRRPRARPRRGDHPVDDAPGASRPVADPGLAAAADRQGSGDQRAGGQRARQAVRPDAQGHEAGRPRQDAGPWRADAPGAMIGRWRLSETRSATRSPPDAPSGWRPRRPRHRPHQPRHRRPRRRGARGAACADRRPRARG